MLLAVPTAVAAGGRRPRRPRPAADARRRRRRRRSTVAKLHAGRRPTRSTTLVRRTWPRSRRSGGAPGSRAVDAATLRARRRCSGRRIEPGRRAAALPGGARRVSRPSASTDLFAARRRIVVITGDTAGRRDGRPGDPRLAHRAARCAEEHDVRLVSTTTCTIEQPALRGRRRRSTERSCADIEAWCGHRRLPGLRACTRHPWLATARRSSSSTSTTRCTWSSSSRAEDRRAAQPAATSLDAPRSLNQQLRRGDFFLCASEKQRHFWLGQLAGVGRLNPAHLRPRLVAAAPCSRWCRSGCRGRPPVADPPGDQGRRPRHRRRRQGHPVGRRRLQLVRPAHPDPGGRPAPAAPAPTCGCSSWACKHPNPHVPEMRMAVGDAASWPTSSGSPASTCSSTRTGCDYDDRAELPARRRRRGQHALPARRDDVLLPHPDAGLPVGRAAHRRHRG